MGGTHSTCGLSELQENLEGGRSIGKSRQRWENNVNVDIYGLDLG